LRAGSPARPGNPQVERIAHPCTWCRGATCSDRPAARCSRLRRSPDRRCSGVRNHLRQCRHLPGEARRRSVDRRRSEECRHPARRRRSAGRLRDPCLPSSWRRLRSVLARRCLACSRSRCPEVDLRSMASSRRRGRKQSGPRRGRSLRAPR
jgi:hypothetical protein